MTAAAKEGGAWPWDVPSRSSRLLSTSLPSYSLLSPPAPSSLLFSSHLSSPISSSFLSISLFLPLHPLFPSPPTPVFCFSQCWGAPPLLASVLERETRVRGPEPPPKVSSASKYLLLCLHTKINTPVLLGDSHCPLCLWKVRPARSGRPQWQRPQCPHRGHLVAHTKHPAWPLSFRSRNPPQRASHRSFSSP